MNAAQIADEAIAKMDAEEAGIVADDDKNPKGDQDGKDPKDPAKDDGTGKSKPGEDGKKSADEETAKPKYDKDGKRIEGPAEEEPELDKDGKPIEKPKEGEFTADDALETDEKPKPNEPAAPKDAAGIVLSPQEQKHIADNIGEPIIIRGVRGEGDKAKEVEIKAWSPQDIPADFKFTTDQQMMAANEGFRRLENRAQELLGQFRQNQSQQAATDFEKRENEGIKQDIADLQKDGRFPKFTVRPGTPGFDESPEAQQVTEVLELMTNTNEKYLKLYEQGRPYKHIGFAEAFDIWERQNPERQASKKAAEDQKKEDQERQRTAETGQSNRGMANNGVVRPTVRAGTTTRDILARIDADDSF